jgi:hypothetical protein
MGKTHLVIPDPHAHPKFSNERADLLAQLIIDLKPDVVVNMGDQWDLDSLSSYDKGKRSFVGRSYRADIESGVEFSDRMWGPVKKRKKRLPERYFLVGNHEQRIDRVLDLSPELEGTVGYDNLMLDDYYDHVIGYDGGTPGVVKIDGVNYAHYGISGVMGRPIGGIHPGYSLITKQLESFTCGHIHTFDHCVRTNVDGKKINGLCAGVFQDYDSPWAGKINNEWSRGLVIKHEVHDGQYDLEWVSMRRLKKIYG